MTELQRLQKEYDELLNEQKFIESELDYSALETHLSLLNQLAKVGNSGVTVFDMYQKKHVFASYNFGDLFGYDLEEISQGGNEYFNARVHPDDLLELTRNGIVLLKYFYGIPKEERYNYKFVSEYRILGNEQKYIRIIEQHQPLEFDAHGNIWLTLGILDISPNQQEMQGIKTQVLNYKTGNLLAFPVANENIPNLTMREKEILSLINRGLLSKEISDKLSISVHTVNTHRQRILEKFNADNSMEAVRYAYKLGLLE